MAELTIGVPIFDAAADPADWLLVRKHKKRWPRQRGSRHQASSSNTSKTEKRAAALSSAPAPPQIQQKVRCPA